ncbi:MAG TPA: UGSC family (seleno)protein [Methanobacteriaceae archaeon]|nr:UGSC family (seleno)protein [Methanobacteriaceae archaeon]
MSVKVVEREVLSPLGEIENKKVDLNQFPDDFETVALVDNTKPGADVVLDTLKDSFGNRKFIDVKKAAGAPATPEQLKNAANSDLAILALGDCGSCTSWVVLDAIRLEELGTPTISICSDNFIHFARELASSHGLSDLRMLEVEHPIAGLSRDEIEDKTLKIIPALQYLLQIP